MRKPITPLQIIFILQHSPNINLAWNTFLRCQRIQKRRWRCKYYITSCSEVKIPIVFSWHCSTWFQTPSKKWLDWTELSTSNFIYFLNQPQLRAGNIVFFLLLLFNVTVVRQWRQTKMVVPSFKNFITPKNTSTIRILPTTNPSKKKKKLM